MPSSPKEVRKGERDILEITRKAAGTCRDSKLCHEENAAFPVSPFTRKQKGCGAVGMFLNEAERNAQFARPGKAEIEQKEESSEKFRSTKWNAFGLPNEQLDEKSTTDVDIYQSNTSRISKTFDAENYVPVLCWKTQKLMRKQSEMTSRIWQNN
eukprot:m.9584 g.9584  ORF g.9584 m.9584 type:complete len:154 (+) comp21453_c0_seq1:869-1330(+)